jgi:predicted nucleotidyltransferase component of viral defense system
LLCKISEILGLSNLPHKDEEKILIRVDAGSEEKYVEPSRIIIDKFDVYRTILANPIEVILTQKLAAIIQRKREKGRDFYDVNILFGKTQPDYDYAKSNWI